MEAAIADSGNILLSITYDEAGSIQESRVEEMEIEARDDYATATGK